MNERYLALVAEYRQRGLTPRASSPEEAAAILRAGRCLFCPRMGFRMVMSHIALTHGVYKDQMVYLTETPLERGFVSASDHARRSEQAKQRMAATGMPAGFGDGHNRGKPSVIRPAFTVAVARRAQLASRPEPPKCLNCGGPVQKRAGRYRRTCSPECLSARLTAPRKRLAANADVVRAGLA